MQTGIVQKLTASLDQNADNQFENIMQFFRQFPYLGVLGTDPTTTGWGAGDICWWINNSTATAVVIKFWNGGAIRTVSST